MNADPGHRSNASRTNAPPDRRVSGLVSFAHQSDLQGQARRGMALDPHRGMALELLRHDATWPIHCGKVVYSLPYANWYKVVIDGVSAPIGCCSGEISPSLSPIGVRTNGTIQAGSLVIVMRPPSLPYGVIVATLPSAQHDGRQVCPDWISQGSTSGIGFEDAYRDPFKRFYKEGGILDFAANRPRDSTTMEWGQHTETGMGIHLDPFLAFVRANEMSGIWFNYFDSYTRLAGLNMDWDTAAHSTTVRDDEGENHYVESHYTYPWEGLGLYAGGTEVSAVFDPAKVQFELPKGTLDLPDGQENIQPFARYQEYGGYLGQGRRRIVAAPPKASGKRTYDDDATTEPDFGVFSESVGLDGTYSLTAAKQIFIGKRTLIPVPKQIRPPEGQQVDEADDARQGNYKFSGTYAGGESQAKEHKVGDVKVDGEHAQARRAASAVDLMLYAFNWQAQHPFHYHANDYKVPEESQISRKYGVTAQEKLDYGQLTSKHRLPDPTPKTVPVDHRYKDVQYFERNSGVAFLPDGGVKLFDGAGAEIVLCGDGNIRITCPGNIEYVPGKSLVVLAGDDAIIRAKQSVDITAGNKDVHIKAERNMQVLSNNGGVLVESKASGFQAEFENKIGEDVVAGGVIIKSAKGAVVNYAGEIYIRTGTSGGSSGDLRKGQIVIDAAKGESNVVLNGRYVETYTAYGLASHVGSFTDGQNNIESSHLLGHKFCILDGSVSANGGVYAMGNGFFDGNIQCQSGFGSVTNQYVGETKSDEFSRSVGDIRKTFNDRHNEAKQSFRAYFIDYLYAGKNAGVDQLIAAVGFSYRDDTDGVQYSVADFHLYEPYWQQMVRFGQASGGTSWTEPVVVYQGQELLPYPGKKKWQDEPTMVRLKEAVFADAAGYAIDRNAEEDNKYEDPKLAETETVTPAEGFKTIT